jgi:hypothetical protein
MVIRLKTNNDCDRYAEMGRVTLDTLNGNRVNRFLITHDLVNGIGNKHLFF